MKREDVNAAMDWPLFFKEQALVCSDSRLRTFYEHGCISPDTPLSETPFVALDFETTGLDSDHDEIVSIGLVPFDLNRVRLREARHWLLKPRKPLVEESVVYHGITHTDIDDAPDLGKVSGAVLEAIAGRVVVVHFRDIERPFLDSAFRQRIKEGIGFPVVDTMELEARIHRKGLSRVLSRLIGRRPASIRLSDTRVRYSLPRYNQHHALTDAIATAELLQAQIRHRYTENTPISDIWC